jgi:hypothetical protein
VGGRGRDRSCHGPHRATRRREAPSARSRAMGRHEQHPAALPRGG